MHGLIAPGANAETVCPYFMLSILALKIASP